MNQWTTGERTAVKDAVVHDLVLSLSISSGFENNVQFISEISTKAASVRS